MPIPLSRSVYLVALVLLLGAAFALRVIDLDAMPRGQHYDEALKVMQSWQLLKGQWTVLFTGGPPEPFNIPIRAAWFLLLPPSTFGARMLTVFIGMIVVAAVVPLTQVIFRRHANCRWIALVALIIVATLPTLVLIHRQMYRANYVPLFAALGVALLWYGMDTRRRWALFAGGFCCAWACVFYLGGLFFLPALAVILVLTLRRWTWRELAVFALGFGLPWIPWGFIMLLMPDTIQIRTNTMQIVSFSDGSVFTTYLQTLATLFIPNQQYVATMIYSVSTLPLLPLWSAPFIVIGALRSLWNVRVLSLTVTILAFLGAVSTTFEVWHPLRAMGHFPFSAVLIAYGIISVAEWLPIPALTLRRGGMMAFIGIMAVTSVASTWQTIRYKFYEDPAWQNEPNYWLSFNSLFHYGLTDTTEWMKQQPERAFYVPLDTVNQASMAALLMPFGYTATIWDGSALPEGTLVMPVPGYYDFPPIDIPLQYALIQGNTITVLPPVSIETGAALLERSLTVGDPIMGIQSEHETVRLLSVGSPDLGITALESPQVLNQFGDVLQLVGVDAPDEVVPGQRFPVTTYWRITEDTSTDFFLRVQPLDAALSAQAFPSDGWMMRFVYPVPDWQVGDIVPITSWMTLYDDAPGGAYTFLIGVYTVPGYRFETVVQGRTLTASQALAGYTRIALTQMSQPLPDAVQQNVTFAEGMLLESTSITRNGDEIDIRLTWRVTTPTDTSYTVFVHGIQNEQLVAQRDFQPYDGRLPMTAWRRDEQITLQASFSISEFAPDQPIRFDVGLYDPNTLERASVTHNNRTLPDSKWIIGELER